MASQCYFYRYNDSWDSLGDTHGPSLRAVFKGIKSVNREQGPWTRVSKPVHGSCIRPVNTTR